MNHPSDQSLPATQRDPRLDVRLASLHLSKRAERVCKLMNLLTLGDFQSRAVDDFLQTPGCGQRTYQEIRDAVAVFLATATAASMPITLDGSERLLTSLVRSARARAAFEQLGLRTVADLLRTPRSKLLAVPGFGAHTYDRVFRSALAACGQRSWYLSLLPERFVQLPLRDLCLDPQLVAALAEVDLHTVGDVLAPTGMRMAVMPGVGTEGTQQVRRALENLIAVGVDSFDVFRGGEGADKVVERLLSLLVPNDRDLLGRHLGLAGSAQEVGTLARTMKLSVGDVREQLERARVLLIDRGAGVLRSLREQVIRGLRRHEGVLTADQVVPGTLLHAAITDSPDRELPFRLLCFCYPRQFHLHGRLFTETSIKQMRSLLTALAPHVQPRRLPIRIDDLEDVLTVAHGAVPRGLLTEVARTMLNLEISDDGAGNEILVAPADAVADRLVAILEELTKPTLLEDLMFHYRDRHHAARKNALLQHLRADPRFIEVGRERWSLRAAHARELDAIKPRAERFAELILRLNGRHNVRDLAGDEAFSEGDAFLLTDCLRSYSFLRDLGRGDFCPRGNAQSHLVRELTNDFRRAMGDVPRSRFLVNLAPPQRRIYARLLRDNRLFVEPAPDRVDLLSNYPFNEERLHRLLVAVERQLERGQGYATLEDILAQINATDLGGAFMTRHLLRDLLRRHSSFELLPGDLVCLESLELSGWIQLRAREAIRAIGMPLTPAELADLTPELGKFTECLALLMSKDPLLQTPDGERYAVV